MGCCAGSGRCPCQKCEEEPTRPHEDVRDSLPCLRCNNIGIERYEMNIGHGNVELYEGRCDCGAAGNEETPTGEN